MTAGFIALCLLSTLLAVALVARPLWRGAAPVRREEETLLAIHRRKDAELTAELAAGVIDANQANARRAELEAALLADWSDQPQETTEAVRASRWAALGVVLAAPLLAFAVYNQIGTWPAAAPSAATENLAALADTLAQRLASHPEEGEGWVLLGRSYAALGRQAEAAQAFATAIKRLGEAPGLLADRAQALALQLDPPRWEGEPTQLLQRALALDANHPQSQWLAGVAALAAGDAAQAGAYWRHLLTQVPPNEPAAASLREALTQIGQAPAANTTSPATPGPTVEISLSPELVATLSPDMTVFVVVRGTPEGGMPVAALRRRVADLPLSMVLSDDMSLMPQRPLSALDTLWVSARISRSGSADSSPDEPRAPAVSAHWGQGEAVRLVIGGAPPAASEATR
ncbi:MAG: c-type cytochrome biogenesis protein CcmI [Pseudomonadota bacterium]